MHSLRNVDRDWDERRAQRVLEHTFGQRQLRTTVRVGSRVSLSVRARAVLCRRETCRRKEGRKEGRKECLCVCCAQLSLSVCQLVVTHFFFLRKGNTACHVSAADSAASPFSRVWHTVTPCAYHLLSTNTWGSQVLLSPLVWFSAALQRVVSDTRVLAHESSKRGTAALSWRGSTRQPLCPGLGSARWHWAVLPLFSNAKFIVCAVLPRVLKVHHGTAAPLES